MSVWEAVLLGVVQGLTEFLPISSTAHLVLTRRLLGHETPEDAFTTVIQLGTLVAVFAYFRADVVGLARGLLADVSRMKLGATPEGRTAWLVILGSFPAGIAGLTLKKVLKANFYTLHAMAWVAIAFALLMWAAEWWGKRRERLGARRRDEHEVTLPDALWVGLWQAFALMPGGSRSGTTITAGLFAGLARPAAARFSFLLSLPIILAAGLKELYDERKSLLASGDQAIALAVGLVVSAAVGYAAIAWLLGFLKKHSTTAFVVYRLILGVAILAMLAAGVVTDVPK